MNSEDHFDPTRTVALDFTAYVRQRQLQLAAHTVGGAPDYAFSLDAHIRSKLASVGILRTIGQALNAAAVPIQRQFLQMEGVAVGPRHFPEVHAMGEACARTLGISIPQIFIKFDPHPNAWTFATSDVDQIIVLTSSLVQACEPLELKSVIGHECGHIHNQHVVYNTVWEMLANPLAERMLLQAAKMSPGIGTLLPPLQTMVKISLAYLYGRWHRSAEFTCDRAGLICCGDLQAALNAQGKLRTGEARMLSGFNPEEYARQRHKINESPLRFLEIFQSHPFGPKRVEAMQLFGECEVLYAWRPELRGTKPPRRKAEVDSACEALLM